VKKLRFARIKWVDAGGNDQWEDNDRPPESLPVVHSCGILLQLNDKAVTITHSVITEKGQESRLGRLSIPRGCIKSVRVQKEGSGRWKRLI